MGEFAVDAVEGAGPLRALTVTATAADMTGAIRAARTRDWQAPTLAGIARTIAGEAGLRAVVSPSLAGVSWRYLAQTAESNLHFLARLARDLDATAKPAGGALVIQRRGEGLSAAGDALAPALLQPADLTDWTWRRECREGGGTVEAEWSDPATGRRGVAVRGAGTGPGTRLRHVHASKAEADRAAAAAAGRAGRASLTFSASLAGFRPDILAGAPLSVAGVGVPEDGAWHVTRAVHSLGGALQTSIEARRGPGGET